jgi:hypothetical protein
MKLLALVTEPKRLRARPSVRSEPALAREAAVRVIHGQPLPIEVLDLGRTLAPADLAPLAAAELATIDPEKSSPLTPAADLLAAGFAGTAYRTGS